MQGGFFISMGHKQTTTNTPGFATPPPTYRSPPKYKTPKRKRSQSNSPKRKRSQSKRSHSSSPKGRRSKTRRNSKSKDKKQLFKSKKVKVVYFIVILVIYEIKVFLALSENWVVIKPMERDEPHPVTSLISHFVKRDFVKAI